ncbi:unnamed protein product, partial [Rotaria magnacalcarata]
YFQIVRSSSIRANCCSTFEDSRNARPNMYTPSLVVDESGICN